MYFKQLIFAIFLILGLFAGIFGFLNFCDKQETANNHKRFLISNSGLPLAEPATSSVGDIWCNRNGHQDFYVKDDAGTFYQLVQCQTNSNLYTVWRLAN